MAEKIEHHQLLRAMVAMVEHQGEVYQVLAGFLRSMVDQDLAVVFYDMTTIRADRLSQQDEDVRKFGTSKEGLIARQVMHGVVQTADALLLYHEVLDGTPPRLRPSSPSLKRSSSASPSSAPSPSPIAACSRQTT